jgi:hypothetical protein
VPLSEFIAYRDGEYAVDQAMIRRQVDAAAKGDSRYTPRIAKREARKLDTQAMYEGWQKAYRRLTKSRPKMSDLWYSQQIAKLGVAEGRNPETIRKHMRF